jgi:hypothetical protein
LSGLRSSDPVRLITMYRDIAGLTVDNQLPYRTSFTGMIEAILASEEQSRQHMADGELANRDDRVASACDALPGQ